MLICTTCGHPAHVIPYSNRSDGLTQAIRVICRGCNVEVAKVGSRTGKARPHAHD